MLALALMPRGALAEGADPVAAYRDALARASAAFDDGDYADARAAFQTAYAIHAEPVLLFDIASTYRREGDLERAVAAYRAFLDDAGDDDSHRALAEETVADLEDQLAAREAPGPDPVPAPIVESVDPPLPALNGEHRGGLPHRDQLLRWSGLACGAAALATLGVAVVTAREASDAEHTLETLPPGQTWDQPQQDLYDRGRAARAQAIGWSIATVALAGSGVALYLYGDRRHASLTVAPSTEGATMTYARTF